MPVSDEEIEQQVRDALASHPHLLSLAIEVRVTGGVVTLEGEVSSQERRRWAEEIARQAAGVVAVHNHLHVLALREHAHEVEHIPPHEEAH